MIISKDIKIFVCVKQNFWFQKKYIENIMYKCQEQDHHHFGTCHILVHMGPQGTGAQDQRPETTVGRRFWAQPLQVSAARNTQDKRISHPNRIPQPSQAIRPNPAQGYSRDHQKESGCSENNGQSIRGRHYKKKEGKGYICPSSRIQNISPV